MFLEWNDIKVEKLISGNYFKERDAEVVFHNQSNEMTSDIKKTLQLILPVEVYSLQYTEENRSCKVNK